jgi:predicted ATPase
MSSDPNAPKLVPLPRRPSDPEPPSRGAVTRPASSRLPVPLTSLIGRDVEVAAARAMLVDDGVRLLTLTGPGGVGKTRLALRIAAESAAAFPDGVVFVSLAPITDPDLVLPAVAREFGMQERAVQPVAELLASYLRQRRLLLVLDNLEQVAAAAPHVAALLEECPGVKVLATSRTRLRVSGEHRFPVSPLALPEVGGRAARGASAGGLPSGVEQIARSAAVQLFVARARAVEPAFTLDTVTAPPVAAICRRLDGLPLAIELAAVRLRIVTPAELLVRLEPALPLLADGPTDAPDRLRTMHNAIAWSYALLPPVQQTALRHLAVFVGGCTLEAAEAVVGARHQASSAPRVTDPLERAELLEALAALVDASLVQRHETSGETRLTMLETVREFGLEYLAASGEAMAIAAAHATFVAELAERAEPHLLGPDERRWESRIEAELGNVRAALAWALEHDAATALRIAAPL